jgi:hypothetical protein
MYVKNFEVERLRARIETLEAENERLRAALEETRRRLRAGLDDSALGFVITTLGHQQQPDASK